ncbi:NAD(P)-binding protein [Periconia macrospinosa]|uniref:NAD(P)-binding protein n=1 Tax=Periconia macrospinosa TaxID=97972 RepID=A0A2V1D183_9PLEO|nr:NAD(P)-binding protein [Periconia macrospinosa]
MVVVAVAGGTGAVGRTLLDTIAKSSEHHAIVLSRTAGPSSTYHGFERVALDYDNIDQVEGILKQHHVDIVVSCLVLVDDESAMAQISLIRAAAQSKTVTRFIPTEFYLDFHAPIPGSDLLANYQLEAEEELLRHPQLTFTLLRAGIFLDHLTMPYNPKKTYIAPFWAFVDIEYEKCVFPEDGSFPLILSHSTDVAAYIERLCGLPANKWPRQSLVASNRLEVRDLDLLIQKVTGKQFQIAHDRQEDIVEGQITQLPSNKGVMTDFLRKVEHQIMLSMLSKAHVLPGKDLAELFPEVQPTKIENFLEAGWDMKKTGPFG